ncbi:MAG: nitroreductase family protein [Promethearchaeota archaeon]|jgi:nitroreductase
MNLEVNLQELIYKRRTIRRFKQDPISIEVLKKLIDFARVAPMATNVQALEFIIVKNPEIRKKVFPLVRWASSLPEEQRTPESGREPTAYIVVMINSDIKKMYVDFDVGAAVQNILLGATALGIGTCWMGAVNLKKVKELFEIPDNYVIKQVISLGYPDENSIIEPFKDSYKYWKDENGTMHVPKRALDDIILKIY